MIWGCPAIINRLLWMTIDYKSNFIELRLDIDKQNTRLFFFVKTVHHGKESSWQKFVFRLGKTPPYLFCIWRNRCGRIWKELSCLEIFIFQPHIVMWVFFLGLESSEGMKATLVCIDLWMNEACAISTCIDFGVLYDKYSSVFGNSSGNSKDWLVFCIDTKDSNLVDSASSIRLSQRLSHACLSINDLYCETANGSLYQL